ncbi:MAG: PadR family transcriptional regulator [Polyangiaceae bacterium]
MLSATQTLILQLLRGAGPQYGLELVRASEGELKKGTVYVTLSRMCDKGLVSVERDDEAGEHPGMPRPRYRATADGLAALEAQQAWAAAMRMNHETTG